VLEQVDQAGERERQLLLGRAGHKHGEASPPCTLDGLAPQRGLADPGLPADEQRPRPARHPIEEGGERRLLGLAPRDVAHGPIIHEPLTPPGGASAGIRTRRVGGVKSSG
jgi:hypothetical protein